MRYSKGLALYKDEPGLGLLLRLIMTIVPASLLIGSYALFSSGETDGGWVTLAEAFVFTGIFLSVFPRGYHVYEDHIRIVMVGPFSIKIRMDKIKSVEVTNKQYLGMNFATRITKKYVAIFMKRGMTIAITPKDNEQFVENANRALMEWAKTKQALNSKS